jgi:hypothetical protein
LRSDLPGQFGIAKADRVSHLQLFRSNYSLERQTPQKGIHIGTSPIHKKQYCNLPVFKNPNDIFEFFRAKGFGQASYVQDNPGVTPGRRIDQ